MGIRVLLANAFFEGIDMADELLKSGVAEFCFNADSFDEDASLDTPNNIHFPRRYGKNADYSKFCNINDVPALSEKDLINMNTHLPMYLNLLRRQTVFPIEVYEEEKKAIYNHFRFWNYLLDKYKINLVYFRYKPHVRPYHYVIYAVAKEKHIPILLVDSCSIPNILVYGNSIEDVGANIGDYYEKTAKTMDIKNCVLEGSIKSFYEKYSHHNVSDIMTEDYFQSKRKQIINTYYKGKLSWYSFLLPYESYLKKVLRLPIKGSSVVRRANPENARKELQRYRQQMSRIRYYLKHNVVKLEEYNRFAKEPDYNKKYIYFALQLEPESTTVPTAGVFGDQITSVQLIARAAQKNGVLVYVKEHYVQLFRGKWSYDAIKNIPNVRLIKTTVPSNELIKNSLAVATQTGTVILEGAFWGKPALVTSNGSCWKGFPSMFQIVDEDQGAKVIESLRKGFSIHPDDLKRYFYSIQKNSIVGAPDDRTHDTKLVNPDLYWKEIHGFPKLVRDYYDKL